MAEIKHPERYGPYLTSNSAPAPFSAFSSQNEYAAFKAFSESIDDDLSLTELATGKEQYAAIVLDKAIRIWGFKIYCRTSITNKDSGQVPYNFKLQGRNSGGDWEDVYANASASPDLFAQWDAGISKYSWSTPKMLEVNSSEEYFQYRILCAECQTILRGAVTATNANNIKLTLLDLFQVEGVANEVERVEFDKTAIDLKKTRTETITATVYPEDATIKTLIWTSSNYSVANVSGGVIEGVGVGTATITATANNGVTATCAVTVTEILIESITIEPAEVTIERSSARVWDLYSPTVIILPEDYTESINYIESKWEIADWDTSGDMVIQARSLGTTTLALEPKTRRTPSASIAVTVVPLLCNSIEPTETNVKIQIGTNRTLSHNVLPTNAYTKTYTLESSNEAVATVEGNIVKSVGLGTAVITATTTDGNATATTNVEVTEEIKYRLADLLNTTTDMSIFRNNIKNDDGTDNLAGVDWFQFNGIQTSSIYVNGNSWIGFGGSVAHLEVCSRDGATYYVYRQEGTLKSGLKFLKIRWEGFSNYSSTSDSYSIKCELFLFSNNDMFLNAIQTPTNSSYLGTSALIVNGVTTALDIPISSNPVISFMCADSTGKAFTAEYKAYPIDQPESVALNVKETNLVAGRQQALKATVMPITSDTTVTWLSSNNSVATVENGTVTGISTGTATVSAITVNNLIATCAVTVITPPPESITLNKAALQLYTGDADQLSATVMPITSDTTVTWESSNNNVATVNAGLVTAAGEGTAIITATTVNGIKASCPVTAIVKINITLNKSDLNLQVTETERLTAIIKPDSASKTVTWASSNTSIITVDNGLVTAIKKGVATITATNVQGHKATCNVVVRDVGDVSNAYVDAIANNRRGMWDAVVTVGGSNVIPREKIGKITLHEILFQDSKIGIGAVVSSYVEIEFRKTTMKLSNRTLTFKIGMTIGDTVEYIQFGKFYVTDVEGNEDDETRTVTAFDSIKKTSRKYKSELTYPSTAKKVAEEIATNCGLNFAEGTTFPDIAIPKKIKAKTCRDVLKTITQLTGCNLVANRASKLEFRWLAEKGITISAQDRYYDFKKSDMDSYIKTVKCTNANGEFVAETSKSRAANDDTNGMDIIFTNPYANQSTVNTIMSNNNITYRAGEIPFLGDPSIQVGDVLGIVDTKGNTYKYPVMENTIEYDGGVKNTTTAYGETEEAQEFTAEKKTTDERINDVEDTTDEINDFISGAGGGGGFSGAVDDAVNKAVLSSGLKAVSVKELPATTDSNTIYFVQEEV